MNIYKPNNTFDFSEFSLDDPGRLQGGAYYSKIKYNGDTFYIETPKCSTKKGIVVTGKKKYCDLIYTTDEYEMINWIIDFEQTIKQLLFTKSELWFHNELDLDDIDYFFNSSIRTYKENSQVMRTYISGSKHLTNTSLQIYDENESIKNMTDVLNKSIKAIICFKGIKFTSTSFQLDIDIKQILIIEQKQIFNKCMISNVHNTLEKNSDKNINNSTLGINLPNSNNIDVLDITEQEDTTADTEQEDTTAQTDDNTCISNDTEKLMVNNKSNSIISNHNINIKNTTKDNTINASSLGNNTSTSKKKLSNTQTLEEYDIKINHENSIILKRPNEVYYDIYQEVKRKAKLAQKAAMAAYLEAKQIKQAYLLDEIYDNSDDDLSGFDKLSEIDNL